ncbi:MAG: DinB family protein [Ardenticatenaceae bacterium]|nr:DinB family protein [Ardenticatenaceae bacterium]
MNHAQRLKHVTATLESTPKSLAVMLQELDEEFLEWRPAAQEWSVKEVIGHLVACDHHAFAGRIQLMLAKDNPTLPKWDMLGEVIKRRDHARSLGDLIEELAVPRLDHVQMILQLTPEDLQRPCISRVGSLTIADFVFEWAYHDLNHIAQIATNLKQCYLPWMGETMRGAVS